MKVYINTWTEWERDSVHLIAFSSLEKAHNDIRQIITGIIDDYVALHPTEVKRVKFLLENNVEEALRLFNSFQRQETIASVSQEVL